MVVTSSLGGLVEDQMQCNLECSISVIELLYHIIYKYILVFDICYTLLHIFMRQLQICHAHVSSYTHTQIKK